MAAMARAEKRARRTRSFYRFNFFGRLAGTAVAIPVLILSALYIPASQSPVMTARDRLHNSPVYQARVKGLSEEQATDLVGDLAAKGVRRLDDHALVARLSAYASMLSNADESTCEAMADGTVTVEQMTQVITNLNQPQKTDFIETNEMAALAELEQLPPPTVSSQEVDQAMEEFVATLSSAEVRRLTAYADSKATQPPREVCFWQRKYFGSIAILPEPHKHVMARFLAEHRSGEGATPSAQETSRQRRNQFESRRTSGAKARTHFERLSGTSETRALPEVGSARSFSAALLETVFAEIG
jgi:hypothetical protein